MTELTRQRGSDFAQLARLIKQAGLLRRRRGHYTVRMAANFAVLVVTGILFFEFGDSWWQLFTAAFLAVVFTQLAFIGHDAGHRQIFRTRWANDAVGWSHGAITGISYGWWVGKHNRHHANPNHEDEDPDLAISVLAFSSVQACDKRGFVRWTTKYQAFLFFPFLLAEAVMLRVAGLQAMFRRQMRAAGFETVLQLGNLVGYLTAVFLVLTPLKAIVFILVHQGLMGIYLGCSFAPNHKGMPVLTKGTTLDYLRKQVLTSRNVRGGWWTDFLLGGLNYQIEHHLFPSMPRPSLRRAQPLVRQFCTQQGISYSECGMISSYVQVLVHLHAVGAPLRTRGRWTT